jgi:primosomal protein N' (replication factor Y)
MMRESEKDPIRELSEQSQTGNLARVIPLTGRARINKPLTYRIPERFRDAVEIGSIVAVPVRNSSMIGVVIGFEVEDETHEASPFTIRDILAVYTDEKILDADRIVIARWMASYYACGLRDALAPLCPEVRALQTSRVLITDDPVKLLDAVKALGLLFSGQDAIKFEEIEGGFRIDRTDLYDALTGGGLDKERAERTIRGLVDSGILKEDFAIRTRIKQLGRTSHLVLTNSGREMDLTRLRSPKQVDVLRILKDVGGTLSREELLREIPGCQSALIALVKKGFLEEIVDISLLPETSPTFIDLTLSAAQVSAVKEITSALETGKSKTFLLFGITGSGKTEVYIESCRRAIELGKRATVLVPEIALTHQAVRRFMQAFPGRIALLHSELTERERLHEWRAVRRGERDIVIGARSALFAPMPDRGLIVIDEEAETAYKQHQRPRYHARDVGRRMAREEGGVLVLGSATPSVESYYAASKGLYTLLRLPARVVGGELPEVQVVCPDIVIGDEPTSERESFDVDGREIPVRLLSSVLRDELKKTLDAGRQAMLFLNLRGFARSLICSKCGWVARCPGCEISLAYHRREHTQVCHHCGHLESAVMRCKRCGNENVRFLGWGTERLEAEVRALFPAAKLMRMDRDTVASRGRRRQIVDAMHRGEVDVLIGTQMIAKGLDFPTVRLVGVVSADQSLHIPDFRAAERTFQLITQVIGRAGRSDDIEREGGGIAIIQSFDPGNRVLQTACSQDYESFYETEIQLRFRFGYPPAVHLARVVVSGKDQRAVMGMSEEFAQRLGEVKPEDDASILGPAPAPFEKLEGNWRFHLILKGSKVSTLVRWLVAVRRVIKPGKGIKIDVDIDPLSML